MVRLHKHTLPLSRSLAESEQKSTIGTFMTSLQFFAPILTVDVAGLCWLYGMLDINKLLSVNIRLPPICHV